MNIREYLLSCLAEEFSESIQETMKCNRFTPEHVHPGDTRSNFERLVEEMADIAAIETLLAHYTGLVVDRTSDLYRNRYCEKVERTLQYMSVSQDLGTLELD